MEHPKLFFPITLDNDLEGLSESADLFDEADATDSAFKYALSLAAILEFKGEIHLAGALRPTGSVFSDNKNTEKRVFNILQGAGIIAPKAKRLAASIRQLNRMISYLTLDNELRKAGLSWTENDLAKIVVESHKARLVNEPRQDGGVDLARAVFTGWVGLWWPSKDGAKLEYLPPRRAFAKIDEVVLAAQEEITCFLAKNPKVSSDGDEAVLGC
jgi:hypothetical protein